MSKSKQPILLAISAISLFLSSCTAVYFENPVPQNARTMTAFPAEFVGVYVSDDGELDNIVISPESYQSGEITGVLGENAVLKPYQEYWVLNQEAGDAQAGTYTVFLGKFDLSSNRLEVFYLNLSEDLERQQKLKEITEVDEILAIDGTLEAVKINPTDQEFKAIIEGDFFLPYGTYTKQ